MASSKQIIEKIYHDISIGNLSSVLPALDEHIAIFMTSALPGEGEFHGRDGFMSMLSRRFQLWESFQKNSLQYFLPEQEANSRIVVTGEFIGKLFVASAPIVMPFVDQWLLRDGKVTEYKVFYWDTIQFLHYVQLLNIDQRSAQNGSHEGPPAE